MEHVFDPLQLCRDAHRITKDGGAFFIVCHNRRAVLARVLGRRSPIYDIEHLQLFSPRSVRVLLERAGFRDVEVRPVVNRYPTGYWAKLLPAPARIKDSLARAARQDRPRRGLTGRARRQPGRDRLALSGRHDASDAKGRILKVRTVASGVWR